MANNKLEEIIAEACRPLGYPSFAMRLTVEAAYRLGQQEQLEKFNGLVLWAGITVDRLLIASDSNDASMCGDWARDLNAEVAPFRTGQDASPAEQQSK